MAGIVVPYSRVRLRNFFLLLLLLNMFLAIVIVDADLIHFVVW